MAYRYRLLMMMTMTMMAALIVVPASAVAKDGPGTQVVRKANEQISQLLSKKVAPGSAEESRLAAQVTASVRDFLDVEALGRKAMRDHWDTLSAEQQKSFMTLLRTLIEKNYIKGLRANLDYQVAYTGESKKGDQVVVSTQVKTMRRGRPYNIGIDYVLGEQSGTLRSFDVITDGVGLVENYRAQFNKIIGKHGVAGLLERMEKKAAAL